MSPQVRTANMDLRIYLIWRVENPANFAVLNERLLPRRYSFLT